MTKTVLVTGAGGFIGSHLTEQLVHDGYTVRAMVHYNFQNNWGWLEKFPKEIIDSIEVFPADIQDPYAVRKAVEGCDTVYHLAALIAIPYSYLAPASYIDTNVKGTLHVLQACLDKGVQRVVHTSTSETYGTAQYVPIDEKHPLVGQSPYSASKIGADKIAESYHLSFDLPVSIIRPFNTFGPRQSARAVIPTVISQALSGVEIIRLGSLSPIRDFTYVKDTVSGFIAIANSSETIGEVTNIGYGKGISVGEIAHMILKACGSSARIELEDQRARPETSEVWQLVCDNSKARDRLGWYPQYSLVQGLEQTIEWARCAQERFKTRIYNV